MCNGCIYKNVNAGFAAWTRENTSNYIKHGRTYTFLRVFFCTKRIHCLNRAQNVFSGLSHNMAGLHSPHRTESRCTFLLIHNKQWSALPTLCYFVKNSFSITRVSLYLHFFTINPHEKREKHGSYTAHWTTTKLAWRILPRPRWPTSTQTSNCSCKYRSFFLANSLIMVANKRVIRCAVTWDAFYALLFEGMRLRKSDENRFV